MTTGWIKPAILFPVAAITRLNTAQLEAVIAHEIFHIKRNDYLFNALLAIAELALFFNPFAKLLSDVVKKEREHDCDDRVMRLGYNAWEYSEALFILGKLQLTAPAYAVAVTGHNRRLLSLRVKRLLQLRVPPTSLFKPATVFFLCLAAAVFAGRGIKIAPSISGAEITKSAMPARVTKVEIASPKEITVAPTTKVSAAITITRQIKVTRTKPSTKHDPEPTHTVVYQEYDVPEPVDIAVFTSEPELLEFSTIEHHAITPPVPVTLEHRPPYIPSKTFYYPALPKPVRKHPELKVISL